VMAVVTEVGLEEGKVAAERAAAARAAAAKEEAVRVVGARGAAVVVVEARVGAVKEEEKGEVKGSGCWVVDSKAAAATARATEVAAVKVDSSVGRLVEETVEATMEAVGGMVGAEEAEAMGNIDKACGRWGCACGLDPTVGSSASAGSLSRTCTAQDSAH
ncbi:MAG: hypothetical protein SGPRY_003805, partial [Prymnesium sp.]